MGIEDQLKEAIASMTEADAIAAAEDHENWAKIWRSIAAAKASRGTQAVRNVKIGPIVQTSVEPPQSGTVRHEVLKVMREHPHDRRWRFSEIARAIPDRRNQVVNNALHRMLTSGELIRPEKGVYILAAPASAQDRPRLTDKLDEEDV